MPIHPIIPLAVSMHANRGVYALLLGSGVSRSAEIPTGDEVTVDLIRRVARLRDESCDPFPKEWYEATFRVAPNYSELLAELARTPAERSQLLRGYFEPTDEQRERGVKLPTAAHRAIAELVKSGHVRVVVTTNFDRLIEHALEAVGVTPTVIASPDAAEGALPLPHSACTVFKLHGDYVDARIRNTEEELASYPEVFDRLLDRILDEYGLVVCGWSADWDPALRAAIERCPSRRFATYWTVRKPKPATEGVQRLIDHRGAVTIPIDADAGADGFFRQVAEHVASLEELDRPHPLSAAIARQTLKRYVADEGHRVRLYDLVMAEVDRIREAVLGENPILSIVEPTKEELTARLARFEVLTEVLRPLIATGCFWASDWNRWVWREALERLANLPEPGGGLRIWANLRRYPALLALYAGGIAAVERGDYATLRSLLVEAQVDRPYGSGITGSEPLVRRVNPSLVLDEAAAPILGRRLSWHLTPNSGLRESLRELLPRDEQFRQAFDRFEYLLGLVHVDLQIQAKSSRWGPIGVFSGSRAGDQPEIALAVRAEARAAGGSWEPLRAGLFDGSIERFTQAEADYLAYLDRYGW